MQRFSSTLSVRVCLTALMLSAISAAVGAQVDFRSVNPVWSLHRDDAIPGSDFPEIDLGLLAPAFEKVGDQKLNLNCLITAKNAGEKVGLNGAWFGGEVVNLATGTTLHTFGQKFKKFNPDARFSWGFPDLSGTAAVSGGFVGVALAGELDGVDLVNQVQVQCRWQVRLPCVEDSETACVQGNNRFKIQVLLGKGRAEVVSGGFNRANFDVLDPDGEELEVKVLNGCPQNDHFWVSAKSKTAEDHTVRVVDLQSGAEVTYSHSSGEVLKNFVDRASFPTCP